LQGSDPRTIQAARGSVVAWKRQAPQEESLMVEMRMRTDAIRFVKELYPRLKPSDEVIERYVDAIDMLPPIAIARDGIIVDGFHRWQAHVRLGLEKIGVEHLGDLSDAEILRESYHRNSTHGHQLSTQDKKRAADHLYRNLPGTAAERITEIASVLGLIESSATKYVATARQDEKAALKERAWELWLDCRTQQQIADELGVVQKSVSNWLVEMERGSNLTKPPASRQHFDVWSFGSDADQDTKYFGKMPEQIVENILWFWTDPGSTIVDLFAGSGTTIEVARRMGRRIWASDRASAANYPYLPIRTHDIADGWPADAPKKADLILLDPPYWKQAAGRYSDNAKDLGNMDIDGFMATWAALVKECQSHLAENGRLAYIVSPAQDGALADGVVVDLATLMLRPCWDAGLDVDRRVIVTYSTQQATGQAVEAARGHRKMLKLYRDLVVLR
jgi:DNA methylase